VMNNPLSKALFAEFGKAARNRIRKGPWQTKSDNS
jgi:hypothetical protein